jgi:hypothetical protein
MNGPEHTVEEHFHGREPRVCALYERLLAVARRSQPSNTGVLRRVSSLM